MNKKVILCILDGWGVAEPSPYNAVSLANTPVWDEIIKKCPNSLLDASGAKVGLPERQMGNSEVGHLNIGAGRIVMQDLVRIDKSIADGTLNSNPELNKFIDKLKATGGTCHIGGLLSDGGVHSSLEHIMELGRIVSLHNINVVLHCFLDGRDTPPKSAITYLEQASKFDIATVSGRYYAMDRDKRWERIEKATDAIIYGKGENFDDPIKAVEQSYEKGITDEFFIPAVIGDYQGMAEGDGFIMANFRADRVRQILTKMNEITSPPQPSPLKGEGDSLLLGMVQYSDELDKSIPAMFPNNIPENTLGEVVSNSKLKQLRIAETEKYAHVTFFFNGGVEKEFAGEERILVPSPKVATYDLKPEMSAYEVTDKLIEAVNSKDFDFILCNYANPDMVGHTGVVEAAVKAVETIDECLGRLSKTAKENDYTLLITADHGNAEQMQSGDSPHTAHTTNKVPFVLCGDEVKLKDGILADIAPTVLKIMGLKKPPNMKGYELF